MAQGLVTHAYLEDIADAIREKLGTEDTYTPAEFADAVMLIPTGGSEPEIVSWSSGTDEQVAAMIDYAHQNPNWSLQTDGGWAVGDVRTITVGSFTDGAGTTHSQQNRDIVISSFDDYMSCGCVMQFDFVEELATGVRMNSSDTNVNGYGSSEMKTTTLPALVNALPTWLKNALVEFSCLSSAGNQSTTIVTVSGNKLALRSEIEVFGSTTFSASGEGSQIPYYSTAGNRVKNRGSGGSAHWWERSPNVNGNDFCMVNSSGQPFHDYARGPYGVSPFGCL